LGHPSKFQRVSRLAFVTAATSLTGGQPNFARCLAVSWADTLYIHCRGLLPLTEFCPVQNSLYVQVLRSRILAVLLHGTSAGGVSHTSRRGTCNGITELSQRAPPVFDRAAIMLGIGPHSSVLLYWKRYCTALEQQASAKICGMLQGMELRNFCRGRHLCSAGRSSRWASVHILAAIYVTLTKQYSLL